MAVKCIKYRLYPTHAQETKLLQTLDICRHVYNSLLLERTALYEISKTSLSRNDQNKHLTVWKRRHEELASVHSQVLQNISERVDLAFKAFFRRVKAGETPGYPRFKGYGTYDSITFPQPPSGCKLTARLLRVSRIGDIACVVHRPLEGILKTCTLRRRGNKWFVCFAVEIEPEALPPSAERVGIDVGIKTFAALSDGSFIVNPTFFRTEEAALARAQQRKERGAKKPGTKRKNHRAKRKHLATKASLLRAVSRVHERIKNRRQEFVHQLSRKFVNQYGVIAVEKLTVKNMTRRPRPLPDPANAGKFLPNGASAKSGLNKSILDAAWSQFRFCLAYKAENAGRELIAVNPAYTTQACSNCGYTAKKLLKERWHHCPLCGLFLDRDTNAAFNILNLATGCKPAVGQHSVSS